ncbi:arylesterase [Curvibacter sp. CHRR-16]|uniref:arylesterase n=1 Tax=Curvibacter sp. CHRR-16 TaxID=2835872 RepID=UPI00202393A2|nr:arylesterase [Curvibacter sp. CHRR-16]
MTTALPAYANSANSVASTPRILVLGDSLSAEYGLPRGKGWVALLEQQLQQRHIVAQVINASISGETTAGGRSRLATLLGQHKPSVVVIELGANDALRGLSLEMTQANLQTMVGQAKAAGAKVLLVGMQVPPNYGPDYTQRFAKIFEQTAKQERVSLVPFLLDGVANAANTEQLFQADRIHPTAQAHPRILQNVWPSLQKLLAAR